VKQEPRQFIIPEIGPVSFRRSARAKRIGIRIDISGNISVSVPPGVSFEQARQFMVSRLPWAKRNIAHIVELRSSIGSYTPNSPVTLAVRPEKIYVKSDASAYYLENVLEGVVENIIYTGVENQYLIRVKDRTFAAYVMNKALTEHEAFNIGNQVKLIIPAQSVVPLND